MSWSFYIVIGSYYVFVFQPFHACSKFLHSFINICYHILIVKSTTELHEFWLIKGVPTFMLQ